MKRFLRDYFSFNRRERNGVFILLSIMLVLILYLFFADVFISKKKVDFSEFEKEVSDFEMQQKENRDSNLSVQRNFYSVQNNSFVDSMKIKKGHSSKHGIPQFFNNPSFKKNYFKKDELLMVELNSADTTMLKQLKGIGSVFAKRIIRFRDLLGGFVSKEQLLELFGFDQDKLDLIFTHISVDSLSVKRMNINSASADDLRRHPYCNKKTAMKIFMQRINHGDYRNVNEIRQLNLVDDELYGKLAPYLTVK